MNFLFFGRSVGIRTRGLLDPNQARYQTSPHPDVYAIILNKQVVVKEKFLLLHIIGSTVYVVNRRGDYGL